MSYLLYAPVEISLHICQMRCRHHATRVCRDRTTSGVSMKLLRAVAVAVAIFVLAPPPPASAQLSPNATWSCEFINSPTDCGFYLQAAASNRAAIVNPGRDGLTAAELTTQPGD